MVQNFTGIDGMINYIQSASSTQGMLAFNFVGVAVILPVFFITFFILARFRPIASFTASSFICMLLTLILMAGNLISADFLSIFAGMTIIGAIMTYYENKTG